MKMSKLLISSTAIATILGAVSITELQAHQSKENEQKISQSTVVKSDYGIVDLEANSQPTQPIINGGQVNQAFINRFNNAITLNSKTGQFDINKKLLPENATKMELATLDDLISQSNVSLKTTISKVSKSDMVQTGNSVVVADNSQTAEAVAQNTKIQTESLFHEGSNYVHHYWWGYRIGYSKSKVQHIGNVLADAGGVAIGLGTALKYCPGGIVFNISFHCVEWGQQFQ